MQKLEGWTKDESRNNSIKPIWRVLAVSKSSLRMIGCYLINLQHETGAGELSVPSSCNYRFSVNSTVQFFEVAYTITSIGVGTFIGLNEQLAKLDLTGYNNEDAMAGYEWMVCVTVLCYLSLAALR